LEEDAKDLQIKANVLGGTNTTSINSNIKTEGNLNRSDYEPT
jgi:hypothetical protein